MEELTEAERRDTREMEANSQLSLSMGIVYSRTFTLSLTLHWLDHAPALMNRLPRSQRHRPLSHYYDQLLRLAFESCKVFRQVERERDRVG